MGAHLIVWHKVTHILHIYFPDKIEDCERGLSDIQVNRGTATSRLHIISEAWVMRKEERKIAGHIRFSWAIVRSKFTARIRLKRQMIYYTLCIWLK
jgi:hypothetical protein